MPRQRRLAIERAMNYLLPRVTRPVGAETQALVVPLAPLLTHVTVVKQALWAQLQAATAPEARPRRGARISGVGAGSRRGQFDQVGDLEGNEGGDRRHRLRS